MNTIPSDIVTFQLRNGLIALGKFYKGEPSPKTFANRTQANAAQAKLGLPWYVWQGTGRPFYVVMKQAYKFSVGDKVNVVGCGCGEITGMAIGAGSFPWYSVRFENGVEDRFTDDGIEKVNG